MLHLVVVRPAVDSPAEGGLVQGVAHPQLGHGGHQAGQELVIGRPLHKHAACAQADLTLVQERGPAHISTFISLFYKNTYQLDR